MLPVYTGIVLAARSTAPILVLRLASSQLCVSSESQRPRGFPTRAPFWLLPVFSLRRGRSRSSDAESTSVASISPRRRRHGCRNGEVVQRGQGFRLYHAGRRRRGRV